MPELSALLANKFYPRFRLVHESINTLGDDVVISTLTQYPCDFVQRDYRSDGVTQLWFPSTGIIRDSIANATLLMQINVIVNAAINTEVSIKATIPHPTIGDILIWDLPQIVHVNNEDTQLYWHNEFVNSGDLDVHIHGIRIDIEATNATTLKGRSMYVRT